MEIFILAYVCYYVYLLNLNFALIYLVNFFLTLKFLAKMSFLSWWDINLFVGINSFSWGLTILSLMILNMVLMNLTDSKAKLVVLVMFGFMVTNFLSMNILFYYFMYESSLIMIYYLVMNWSQSMFKTQASYMLIFYTLFFSLPMLLVIITIYLEAGSLSFLVLETSAVNLSDFMLLYLMLGFLVKIPMFLLHGWLLKAHVEATFFGSMILASIMLKLGGYGILRVLMIMNKYFYLKNYIIVLNLVGSLVMSLLCLQQIDMKLLIAISSVVHMGIMISSMYVLWEWSFKGAYLIMLGHGFSSSGLFYLVNEIYKNTKTRLMIINKGMITLMPTMTLMWFLMCTSNSAAPLSMNLFSEIFMMASLLMFWKILIYVLIFYCFFSFMYSIYLFSTIQHGPSSVPTLCFSSGKMLGFFTVMSHWVPLNMAFLFLAAL